jgi:hypothetical protein
MPSLKPVLRRNPKSIPGALPQDQVKIDDKSLSGHGVTLQPNRQARKRRCGLKLRGHLGRRSPAASIDADRSEPDHNARR